MAPTLFQGIAAAAVFGLVLGAAMRPQLSLGDAETPAFEAWDAPGEAWSPIGWEGPGPAPDYVVGTDFLRPAFDIPDYDLAVEAYTDEPVVILDEPLGPPPELAQWTFAEAAPRPFPSEGGDVLADRKDLTPEDAPLEGDPVHPDA